MTTIKYSSKASVPGQTHPGKSSKHVPVLTQQYALPILRDDLCRRGSDEYAEDGDQTPRPENTLRRKTPNGTLNAGYDSSAENTNPQKHQLSVHDRYGRPETGQTSNYTFVQHEQRHNGIYDIRNSQPGYGWQSSQYPQHHPPPVVDSMLHQMPTQHLSAQQYYGQTVPSVLQPSYQYLGPTASGGHGKGPYGPYYYDGTFVPYRPAAVRDPRFYQHPSAYWPGPLSNAQPTHHAQNWQHHANPQVSEWPTGASSNAYLSNAATRQEYAIPNYTHPHSDQSLDGKQRFNGHAQATGTPWSSQDLTAVAPSEEYGSSSPNGRQRDKTFAWALQQYRELLSYIHHTRRQQQQHRQLHGQHVQRPSFFPKPPRPSRSGSAIQVNKTRRLSDSTPGTTDSMPGTLRAETAPDLDEDVEHDSGISTPKLHAASAWPSSHVPLLDSGYQRRASHEQWQRPPHEQQQHHWLPPPQQLAGGYQTLRRMAGSSVSAMVSQPPIDDSPPSRATVALSYMTKLCRDTEWQWTDGMHLGGCLAYGLGNYQKALRWYTKVLEMDPKHLEATSNLAATLLALGRKQEAEQHWNKVIKAAPNHFEAVEHLVGLLCNEQRSGDAIHVIEYVERSLRQHKSSDVPKVSDRQSECSSSTASRSPCRSELSDKISYDFDGDGDGPSLDWRANVASSEPGFGSSGFAIPGCDNGRILALIHAKGNMLYAVGDNGGAAKAFEDAVLIAAGRLYTGIQDLVQHILTVVLSGTPRPINLVATHAITTEPILLSPDQALATARLCFPDMGELPGLQHVPGGLQSIARKAAVSTTSNSLLSLAKIFQDGMSNSSRSAGVTPLACGVRDILALYYLSLSLQPSPSTANNVGILLASVQQAAPPLRMLQKMDIPGVVPGSGIALALQYYNYGLQLDQHHAHLYTNLGSLLKDIGQLDAAINMYELAVKCDGKFDIALANLANAVKDKGRISDAIVYYKRAVDVSPDFAEAVCGLANALNSVCSWQARGGIAEDGGKRDRWHVDANGMLLDARQLGATSSGWVKGVVDIVEKQLLDGVGWGRGVLKQSTLQGLVLQMTTLAGPVDDVDKRAAALRTTLESWSGREWEGARVTRLIERATRRIGWHWYRDLYVTKKLRQPSSYNRPQLPAALTVPTAPTVLPFHTFTTPMSAKQIRLISQRNGLRISVSALRSPWLPTQVYSPPQPPAPYLRVGYVSSDFNNHPLAHLMQSVFGLHDTKRVKAYCYATTASDNSVHRQQIQTEAPVFHDASTWSAEKLVNQIVQDGIHILVNLNGYTRGARNEIFAARPAPIQMSFMGFAGTLGAEWCDYLLADETAIPPETLRPWRRNLDVEDSIVDENHGGDEQNWVYGENIIYCRNTFFCCDHKQSAPDAHEKRATWDQEQKQRWQMRKELFPQVKDETIIFGNFNQLYKIDPTTFRTWLRVLARVPNSILWLLRFPDLGESHLLATARLWAGEDIASRVIFTDVAPKHLHISRARICDVMLDTAECNAHTTAADVLWSGTPILTLPRYSYKMCSRMAASILKGALPKSVEGLQAEQELIAKSEEDYEEKAVALGESMLYTQGCDGKGVGRLMEMRKMLYHARWTSALFDTKRWVGDLEDAYGAAWSRYVNGEGGDIWLDQVPSKA